MDVEVLELGQHMAGDASIGRLKTVGQALQEISDGDFVLVEHPVPLLLVVLAPS